MENSNISVIVFWEREKGKNRIGSIPEKLPANNFLKLTKDAKLPVQEALRLQARKIKRRPHLGTSEKTC